MAEVKTQDFVAASGAAIEDATLQRALRQVGGGFNEARLEAIEEVSWEAWEQWREEARRIKVHALEHLDYYLELLYEQVTKAGGQVHFARDAAQANAIVAEIAQARGVKVATKSKSMVSEELDLNKTLESVGVDVFETDLGEYIIQLAEETPSHLVAPALHKTKEQVSELFHEKLGVPLTDDIEEMARVAREALRSRFLAADLGISGANFLVAETGTLVIITNEGNGRLCTSAPKIHIGITGMEKVIPSLQDLSIFLRLLPRSATGQRLTSYVSMVTGPRRNEDEDGPEEFHLVLVDNGRSRLLADPELREALYCIRCGACLNICPVYGKIGGHAYGWVYPGPIGAIVSPALVGLKDAKDLPHASSLCGACREVCPIKINIPRMLLHLRHRLAESPSDAENSSTLIERQAAKGYTWLMSNPAALSAASKVGRMVQKPFSSEGKVAKKVSLPLVSQWTAARDLPTLARRSFRQIWADELEGESETRG
ncbi:MAG: LutB/LldF family L-lactate oxidation iron-sulfur protein [Chloroflexi bacterium]|nr:LutB/LldF family L-lactate oxidation iron-sulfur protein [Chloroflexota bacterium]